MTTTPQQDPETGVDCPRCGCPTEFRRVGPDNAHHVCPDCSKNGLVSRLGQVVAANLFAATLTVLALTAVVGMGVYRQAATAPVQDVEYVCNTSMGCTGQPVVGPIIVVFIATTVIAVILRFKNWRAGAVEE